MVMAMDMANMAISKSKAPNKKSKLYNNYICVVGFILFFYQTDLWARNWQFDPSLTIQETYSDNIRLAPAGSEKGAFVTEISPGISVIGKTDRNRVNLKYRMQNLFNAGGNDEYDLNHQLQFNSNTELLRNSLFVDLNSSINQQNTRNIRSSNDNISGDGNRTNITTYGISPYWTPHLHGYAEGEVRLRYEKFMIDDKNQSSQDTSISNFSRLSDAEILEESVRLVSGRRFSQMTWALNFLNREQKRDRGNDVIFQNGDGLLRAHFSRKYNIFVRAGFSDNSFQTQTDRNKNGFFYTVGGEWRPNRQFRLEAGVGNNNFVTVDVSPTRHMHWITTYRHNDIGTNTGSTWETDFEFETKRSIWKASYSEDTTTTQSVLGETQAFTLVDRTTGEVDTTPVSGQPFQRDISLPNLVDEVFIRKRGEISFAYRTAKSDVTTTLFNESRTFQVTQRKDDVFGIMADWNWRFTRRTTFFTRSSWQQTKRETSLLGVSEEFNGDDSTDDRFDFSLGIKRRIPFRFGKGSEMNGLIEYRYQNQISDDDFNEFQENRISASLQLTL